MMHDSLSILAVTNTYPTEKMPGDTPCIKDQIEELRARGHHIDLFYIDRSNKLNYFKAAFRLALYSLKPRRYDLIHAFYGHCGFVARLQTKYPVVVTFRGSDLLGKDGKIGKIAARWAQGVIVMTDDMKQVSERDDARVIPFGVNSAIFRPYPRDKARQELDLPLDEKLILFPWDPARGVKRFDIVEAAFELLRKEHESVRLITIFDQPHDVIATYMNACDVMILASDYEGSPMAVREAIACNLPLVSVDVGDVREIIENVGNCYLVERDPAAIAEKVVLVLASNTRAEWDRSKSKIDAAWAADRVLEVYDSVLNHKER
jgi:teichuronic acid biosynthesis glycosyltransferase TuaC